MPLAATVCSDEIYQTFNSSDPIKTFWHGHSYTANPIGCAAGVASMKILEREEAFKNVEEIHKTEIQKLKNHPKLEHFRITGTIAAMDIKNDEEGGYLNSAAKKIKEECVDHGVLLRPLGNVLYVMAPYCTSEKELQKIYSVIAEIVD